MLKGFFTSIFLFFWGFTSNLYAEGSRELSANGGYRAYLFSGIASTPSFPFPTLGTMKVYVKAGEIIYTGSSAQGFGSGTINLRAPDGSTYSSGNGSTVGVIGSRSQELAGPSPNAGGYIPYTVKVQTGQEGVWEIDFISQSNGMDMGNPDAVPANSNWFQQSGQYVTAFDISVRDAGDTHFLTGRVFTNEFLGILGTFDVGFNGIFHVLTKDGFQYTLDNNGQAGNGFTFFANNKGFRNTDGTASYKSVNAINNPNVQDPRAPDTETDITHKIFFNAPAADLPASANTPGGSTTWLLNTPSLITVSNAAFVGVEGTPGIAGTYPLGANFSFTTTGQGDYSIIIDINHNGLFTDAIDRKLTGTVNTGANKVFWNGLDGLGNKAPASASAAYNTNITVKTKAGEVHFPFFDVERNINGIKLIRTNGDYVPDDTLYWDDTPITFIGTGPNPIKNINGISSFTNGHKWGTPAPGPLDDADFGNNKGIDTWSYILSAPIVNQVSFHLQEADLSIDTITSAAGCAGGAVLYNISVKNNGPGDVTGAKFRFNFPGQISGVSVNSVSTAGISATSGGTLSANKYDAVVDMQSGSVRTFTVNAIIAATSTGTLSVSASILRPTDVTDPDASNPDSAPPTDPAAECNASPSGAGCNNIKSIITTYNATPYAGPDQSVFQYEPATLTATGDGSWTQATGDPSIAVIGTPANASTQVTGLDEGGKYHFVYTNATACTDTVIVTVIVASTTIPNVFTPNNDGTNDAFKIKGIESYPGSQLIIFNRWGNEVYRADNYLNNWNGSGLAEGTYFYVLNRRDHKGNISPFKGWVFLKRSK